MYNWAVYNMQFNYMYGTLHSSSSTEFVITWVYKKEMEIEHLSAVLNNDSSAKTWGTCVTLLTTGGDLSRSH